MVSIDTLVWNSDSIRGFIDAGDTPQPWTTRTGADLESFKQSLGLHEPFVDSHVTLSDKKAELTAGVNVLPGDSAAASLRYGQRLLIDGMSQVPGTESVNAKGTVDFTDRRRFVGVYTQSRYDPAEVRGAASASTSRADSNRRVTEPIDTIVQ